MNILYSLTRSMQLIDICLYIPVGPRRRKIASQLKRRTKGFSGVWEFSGVA